MLPRAVTSWHRATMSLDESAKLAWRHPLWQIVLPLVRPMVAVQARAIIFRDYKPLSSFCFRKRISLQLPLVYKPRQQMWRTALLTHPSIALPICTLFLFFFCVKKVFRTYKLYIRGNIPPFSFELARLAWWEVELLSRKSSCLFVNRC